MVVAEGGGRDVAGAFAGDGIVSRAVLFTLFATRTK
jgi:hypothetical protein